MAGIASYTEAVTEGQQLLGRTDETQRALAKLSYEVIIEHRWATVEKWGADLVNANTGSKGLSKGRVLDYVKVWERYGKDNSWHDGFTFNDHVELARKAPEAEKALIQRSLATGRSIDNLRKTDRKQVVAMGLIKQAFEAEDEDAQRIRAAIEEEMSKRKEISATTRIEAEEEYKRNQTATTRSRSNHDQANAAVVQHGNALYAGTDAFLPALVHQLRQHVGQMINRGADIPEADSIIANLTETVEMIRQYTDNETNLSDEAIAAFLGGTENN